MNIESIDRHKNLEQYLRTLHNWASKIAPKISSISIRLNSYQETHQIINNIYIDKKKDKNREFIHKRKSSN